MKPGIAGTLPAADQLLRLLALSISELTLLLLLSICGWYTPNELELEKEDDKEEEQEEVVDEDEGLVVALQLMAPEKDFLWIKSSSSSFSLSVLLRLAALDRAGLIGAPGSDEQRLEIRSRSLQLQAQR
ncbi:hypothetical protein MUK42_35525 [Musa troglodytarum]|uniref:Uncharacterized protein n=1 Tax=Musa troglodytarum TaxID=320322 RepID=A0A9E7HJR7_9LILI|nr:hypothetical protein MUK42_35525 [Musa troglodytarum]